MNLHKMTKSVLTLILAAQAICAAATEPTQQIRSAGMTGGLVAQVGATDLSLRGVGDRFHVRLLVADRDAAEKAQANITEVGLQGRFTVGTWDGQRLPFAEHVLNALVVAKDGLVSAAEAQRVLAPRGLLITPQGATAMPLPKEIDDWTHYLYAASGNAVSSDEWVGPPKSLRWHAGPLHLRSHNWSAGFNGMVSAGGRVFYLFDDGPSHLEEGGLTERWSIMARDAFNGALLWKRPLAGYGQLHFEDVPGQATPDNVWRSPLSMNRRLVAFGDRIAYAPAYRQGPLVIANGATGETVHEVDVGGCVDEIIFDGGVVLARVRMEILPASGKLSKGGKASREDRGAFYLTRTLSEPPEKIVAVNAESGKTFWSFAAGHVAIQTLAAQGDRVCFHDYEKLVALDKATGRVAWTAAGEQDKRTVGSRGLYGNLLMHDGKVLFSSSSWGGGGNCYDARDGKKLWTNKRMGTTGGFAFPTALRVVGKYIWRDNLNAVEFATGADARGAAPDIGDMLKRGHHVRCQAGKATQRYLITPHRGAEFIDLKGDNHMIHDWLRGACSYGVMPANGMLYVTPDPCSCYSGVKINGLNALSATPPKIEERGGSERLERGPAYSDNPQSAIRNSQSGDWPMYRHDAARSGRAGGPVPAKLRPAWTLKLGGTLTPVSSAGGRVFVANRDTYTLYCVDAATGKVVWQKAFAGALDGPPTIVGDAIYNGCGDGYVYCLNAADGRLAWRFGAAPQERLTLSNERLENVWPVHSSVLFQGNLIYCTAGRNSYLDGGIWLYGLDPATGKVVYQGRLDGPWPTREQMREAVKFQGGKDGDEKAGLDQYATGYDMEGGGNDLLVGNGKDLYLRQNKFAADLRQMPLRRVSGGGVRPMGGRHLMANTGFLDDSYFHRAYWMYEDFWTGKPGGSGTAAHAGNLVSLGEHGSVSAKNFEGGWYPSHKPGSGNNLVYDLYTTRSAEGGNSSITRKADPKWTLNLPIIVRAMLLAPADDGEIVFAAGVTEGQTKAEWDLAAQWKLPTKLIAVSVAGGGKLAESDLPAAPVFDGLAAADGRLFVCDMNGSVHCLAGETK